MSNTRQQRHFNYIDSDKGQIHYWVAGNGPNLLMLHSSGNSSEEFAAIVPYLANHYRILAIDLPGHGRTYNPQTQLQVEDFAAAVRFVLDALDIQKTHIIGHHGGCLSAMSLIAEEPERFDNIIFSGVDEEYLPEDKQALIERIKKTDINVRAEASFMADAWARYMDMRSDGATASMMLKPFIAFLDARLRPTRGILTNITWDRKETLAVLSKLNKPMLFITGDKDSYMVKQERLLSMIPGSTHLTLRGAGTFMFYDYTEQAAKIILDYFEQCS